MRLFKNILAIMAMAVTLSLASCSSSDGDGDGPDDPNNPDDNTIESLIVGTWEYKYSASEKYTYTFYKNGDFESLITESGHQYEENGYYTIDGKIVTLHYDGYNDTFEVKSITRSKIVVKYDGQTLTLNRTGDAPDDDDDDDQPATNPIKSAIIGSWMRQCEPNETRSYTFRDDNTCTQVSYENGEVHFATEGTYRVEGSTIVADYCGACESYVVKSTSDNEIIVIYDDMTLSLNRVNTNLENSYEKLVIGKWKYETGSQTDIMTVNADGTFSINTTVAGQEGELLTTGTWAINHNDVTLHITHDGGEDVDIYSYLSICSVGVADIVYRLISDSSEMRYAYRM